MNILFITFFFFKIYGFRDTESDRIRALSVFGYYPLSFESYGIEISHENSKIYL